jgi:hypothetical protein
MTTLSHKFALALAASLSAVTLAATAAAAETNAYLASLNVDPGFGHSHNLPKFGFSSFNLHGAGERVTYVRWGGLASQFGLEPGDLILSMNGIPLSYQGSWNDALCNAMENGGWVRLRIRDVRTGRIFARQMFVGGAGGGNGPIVNHYKTDGNVNNLSAPNGPITLKSTIGPQNGNASPKLVK